MDPDQRSRLSVRLEEESGVGVHQQRGAARRQRPDAVVTNRVVDALREGFGRQIEQVGDGCVGARSELFGDIDGAARVRAMIP
jgi:hypothetical protein